MRLFEVLSLWSAAAMMESRWELLQTRLPGLVLLPRGTPALRA